MIFSSFEFLLFFAAVLALRAGIRDLAREKRFLLAASWLFYMSWGPRFVLLIIFTSLVDWWIGLRLGETADARARRRLLATSLGLNLGVLAFFKYTNFVVANGWLALRALGWEPDPVFVKVLLPVGISFFTFQSMSYTIDVYRREIPPCRSPVDLCLFVAFFPQLVAGPIVRAKDLLPQLQRRTRATHADFERGLLLFGIGAFKKLVISDQIAPYVDLAFARPADFGAAYLLQGLVGYAIQIYCDFSGYSDMAIGVARMMGYEFKENFRMPYAAQGFADFWHRWHISLSTWLRDYLYIPLGGNRKGEGRTYVNLMITMLLGGLWHGARWNFVIWGAVHGAALCGERLVRARRPQPRPPGATERFLAWAATMGVVLLGWVFFRSPSLGAAITFLHGLAGGNPGGAWVASPQILAAVALMAVAILHGRDSMETAPRLMAAPLVVRLAVYTGLLTALASFGATYAAPFIYFQF
jgi:D-alanyl-lipoteichoic acid acyltransferase DltB (MBOAT superfamily)